jgi:hypothetical protein
MDLFAESFCGRLAGLFEAIAVTVKKPAVIKTAQAAVLDAAIT